MIDSKGEWQRNSRSVRPGWQLRQRNRRPHKGRQIIQKIPPKQIVLVLEAEVGCELTDELAVLAGNVGKVGGEDGGGVQDVAVGLVDPDGKQAGGRNVRSVSLFFDQPCWN